MRSDFANAGDDHIHSQWSWDTSASASMDAVCAAAVERGLPAVTFTEHLDFTEWFVDAAARERLPEWLRARVDVDGLLRPAPLDVDGYLDCLERCRTQHPTLWIRAGLEIGEPHWHASRVQSVTQSRPFQRVIGSMHTVETGGQRILVTDMFDRWPADRVVRTSLVETARMVAASDDFEVLGHVDYAVRRWPATAGPFDPASFEAEFRDVLRTLAGSGRALEINTLLPLATVVVQWWCDEGGQAITVGSDAHSPARVGSGSREASELAAAHGFRPGRHVDEVWSRRRPL